MKYLPIVIIGALFFIHPVFGQAETSLNAYQISQLSKYNTCQKLSETPDQRLFEKYAQAIAAQPKNVNLYLERAKCFKITNDYEEVLKDVSTILTLRPKFGESFCKTLDELVGSTDLNEQKSLVDYLTANNGNHFYTFAWRAYVEFRTEDFQGAIDDYLTAAEIEPRASLYRFILEDSLSKSEKDENIFEMYNRSFNVYEKALRDLNLRILQNKGSRKNREDLQYLTKRIGSKLHAFSEKLADLYINKKEIEKAEAVLARMVQIPPYWSAYQSRSWYYQKRGYFKKSKADAIKSIKATIEDIDKLIVSEKNPPSKAILYLSRGNNYLELGQYNQAIADYETAKTIDKNIAANADEKINLANQKRSADNNQPK
jgi:tetratricopeptide (TPR) repeat protein